MEGEPRDPRAPGPPGGIPEPPPYQPPADIAFDPQAQPPPPQPQSPVPPPPAYQQPPVYQPPPQQYGGAIPPGGWQPAAPATAMPSGALASWGSRLGAYLIDALIVVVPVTLVVVALSAGLIETDEDSSGFVALVVSLLAVVLAWIIIAFLYAPLLMKRAGDRNGQTWGKQILGIRVVRTDGKPVDFWAAVLREVALKGFAVGVASSMFMGIPWLLNFLWPLWDDQNRAVHDMAASTWVVEAR